MNRLSQRYWIVFFILLFTEIIWITFISGIGVPLLYTALYLFLFGYFLPDPLEEYGIHFRKVPMQAVSGIILALFTILPILLMDLTVSWKWLPFLARRFIYQFTSCSSALLYLGNTVFCAIQEELAFRGFLLTFFQKLFKNSFFSGTLCASIFAVSHYPGGQNLEQVLFAFITGFIYGALRIKKPENFTIFSLCLAHILHNISYDLITCYITM